VLLPLPPPPFANQQRSIVKSRKTAGVMVKNNAERYQRADQTKVVAATALFNVESWLFALFVMSLLVKSC
jgi:hypothetical protein